MDTDKLLGVQSGATSGLDEMMGLVYCVGKAWPQCKETGIPKEGIYNLDTLAAWLWERGCRA